MRQMSKPYTPSDTFVLVLIPTILGALCLSILRDITIPACVPRSKLGYERSRRIGYGRVSGSQWAPSGPTGSPVRLFWRVFRVLPTLGRAAGRAESFWRRGRRGGRINYLWISALYRDCHTTHVIQAQGHDTVSTLHAHLYLKMITKTIAISKLQKNFEKQTVRVKIAFVLFESVWCVYNVRTTRKLL